MHEPFEITTVLIAFFAFIATCLQAIAAWKQNRQAVRPFLNIDWEIDQTKYPQVFLKFYVENVGCGPAIISDWYITYEGNKYKENLIVDALKSKFINHIDVFWLRPTSGIGVNSKYYFLKIQINGSNLSEEDVVAILEKYYVLNISYKSVHNQKFHFKSSDYLTN